MSGWNNLFYTYGKNYTQISVSVLALVDLFNLNFPHLRYFIVPYALSYITVQQGALGTSHIFLPQTLESGVSPRIFSSCKCRMVFRNRDLSATCSRCYQCDLASGPFRCMYLYIHSCVCIYMYEIYMYEIIS